MTQIENALQMACHSCEDDPKPGRATRDINQHMETPTIYATMKKDRPVSIPMSLDRFYLRSRDAPLVRQVKHIERLAGIYIGPFKDKIVPARNITNQSEDHNWRRRKKKYLSHRRGYLRKKLATSWDKQRTPHI